VRDLVIVGAGGLGRETAEAVRAVNVHTPTWRVVGFVDDAVTDQEVAGIPVLGPVDRLHDLPDVAVVIAVASPTRNWNRALLVDRLGLPADRFATVVHPDARLAAGTEVGHGSVVLAGVIATTALRIGGHVVMMPATVLTHDDDIAGFATIASGVRLAGGVRVAAGAYVGAGALVRENVSIGAWSLVGMGAAVVRDVPPHQVWAGIPARHLRDLELPDGVG
jgi:sugar O-acyltransferase (sialic acid O-acetyltransferase NeuD family)